MNDDKSKESGAPGTGDTAGTQPPAANAPPAKEVKAKAADKAPEPPTFRDADYSGPLTGDQAAWRNANLKPAHKVRTK